MKKPTFIQNHNTLPYTLKNFCWLKYLFTISFFLFIKNSTHAYKYSTIRKNNHIIHIVEIKKNEFRINIVKAYDSIIGRESLKNIAKRSNAEIAINAGFFEIGDRKDGVPSGTLIINNEIYRLIFIRHPIFWCNNYSYKVISDFKPSVKLIINNKIFNIDKINVIGAKNSKKNRKIYLFTPKFGRNTFTSCGDYLEIYFDKYGKFIKSSSKGNSPLDVPYIVSIPRFLNIDFDDIKKSKLVLNFSDIFINNYPKSQSISCVSGYPILLKSGKIPNKLINDKGSFHRRSHIRTCLGTRENGDIIIIVVDTFRGYSLLDMAKIMQQNGCVDAINLDGGKSSALWIKNRGVVNNLINKRKLTRVSNAICFFKSTKSSM